MDFTKAHDLAVAQGLPRYTDPATGYQVFTEPSLIARGKCCGSACRHCPFAHVDVRGRYKQAGGRPVWFGPRMTTLADQFGADTACLVRTKVNDARSQLVATDEQLERALAAAHRIGVRAYAGKRPEVMAIARELGWAIL